MKTLPKCFNQVNNMTAELETNIIDNYRYHLPITEKDEENKNNRNKDNKGKKNNYCNEIFIAPAVVETTLKKTTKTTSQSNVFYGESRTTAIFLIISNINFVVKYRMEEPMRGIYNIISNINIHKETLS